MNQKLLAALIGGTVVSLLSLPIGHAAPADWEFSEVILEPRLSVQAIAIAPSGRMAFFGEKLNAAGERVQQGVYLQESADSPSIPLALMGEALPGGLGTLGFVEDIRVDAAGRVFFEARLDNVSTTAVLRWDNGEISRMLPDDKDFEHHLEYFTSDGRWIVEDRRLSNRNANAILTNGIDFARLPQGFGPRSLPCGREDRTHAVPNAQGAAIFQRYLSQDTELKDEEGTVVGCSGPTTLQWSLSRSGPNPGVIVSGVLAAKIGTNLVDAFNPADAAFLFSDAGEALFLREHFNGSNSPVSRDLVRASAAGAEQVVLSSPPFGNGTPLVLLGFDSERRLLFTTRTGIFAGPDLVADRVLTEGDILFGSGVLFLNAVAAGGPGTSLIDRRSVVFTYQLEDNRAGIAVATRKVAVDPAADTDGDGLLDAWEKEGGGIDVNDDGTIDLDLFALGARPDHKDVFVEVDATLAQRPIRAGALGSVVTAFANAPVSNPDNVTGIRLHLDIDENSVVPESGTSRINELPAGFRSTTKPAHFGTLAQRAPHPNRDHILAAKRLAYRYCLIYAFVNFGETPGYLGIAEIGGNDFVINLGGRTLSDGFRDTEDQASTFMHELGHTLGLRHGGGTDQTIAFQTKSWQGKPNYPSIMNYALTHPHRWSTQFWRLDYSREALSDLEESSLNENTGIPSQLYTHFAMPYGVGPANRRAMRLARLDGRRIDFDGNRRFTADATADLNFIGAAAGFAGVDQPSPDDTMKGHNDWASLQYRVVDGDGGLEGDVELADGCPTPEIHDYLATHVPVEADTYTQWIALYAEDGPDRVSSAGFSDDPDHDGIPNGIERYFGSHPARPNTGLALVPGSAPPAFRHSRTPSPPPTLSASFQWSVDLKIWKASGTTANGFTVHLEPITLDEPGPLGDMIEVVPRIEGAPPRELFLRMNVEETGE